MTIWEISEKADYIADRHRQQQEQWHIYCNSLVQGITLSKARLHHAMSCAPDKELCFVLFGHFQVFVALAEGFNSHTIEYYVENKNGGDKYLIAQATLAMDGTVDGRISNRSRDQVLDGTYARPTLPSITSVSLHVDAVCRPQHSPPRCQAQNSLTYSRGVVQERTHMRS